MIVRASINAVSAVSAPATRMFAATVGQRIDSRRYTSTMHDNDPTVLENEKQKNLNKTQFKSAINHAPGWNETLASASEAHVKADKVDASPADLQASTVEYMQGRHNPDDRASARRSTSDKDEVTGPLSSAKSTIHHNSDENGNVQRVIKRKTVHDETTEVVSESPTDSEEGVKADRGEV